MNRVLVAVALAALLSACGDALVSSDNAVTGRVPLHANKQDVLSGQEGNGRYVIVLNSSTAKSGVAMEQLVSAYDVDLDRRYRTVLRGGAARLTPEQVRRLERDPRVATVQPDQPVWMTGVQASPPWGLDRIDQRYGLDSIYAYTGTGEGVDVYVVDSGIYASHQDFGGRVSGGVTFADSTFTTSDCDGHGTHVAGTVGGATYGVAKGVRLIPIRVFGCDGNGYSSDVIAALDWVVLNAEGPSVVNMSLGSVYYAPVNQAVQSATSAGIVVVVAAGNEAEDACDYSPASAPSAITVAAAASDDSYASFSNYGACVDLFAPGVDITSAYIGGPTTTAALQGTSMASPHVAGAAALLLAYQPDMTPAEVEHLIVEEATQGAVSDPLTPNNHMLFSPTSEAALWVETSQYWQYRSAELTWVGLTGDRVELYQNDTSVGTTENDGKTSITLGWEATGTYRYQLCITDGSVCTPEESISL